MKSSRGFTLIEILVSLLILATAFLPVMTLEAEEGRLCRPLAYTKTLATIVAALLAVLKAVVTALNTLAQRRQGW